MSIATFLDSRPVAVQGLSNPSCLSRNDWALLDTHETAWAVTELSASLNQALDASFEAEAWAIMAPTMARWAECGACDPAPRQLVQQYFKAAFGQRRNVAKSMTAAK